MLCKQECGFRKAAAEKIAVKRKKRRREQNQIGAAEKSVWLTRGFLAGAGACKGLSRQDTTRFLVS